MTTVSEVKYNKQFLSSFFSQTRRKFKFVCCCFFPDAELTKHFEMTSCKISELKRLKTLGKSTQTKHGKMDASELNGYSNVPSLMCS
jgi:hypothetical protein